MLELAASCMHGYKNGLFDGFSGFLNWISERSTGPLLWAFLFILGRSIDWHTYLRMVLNHLASSTDTSAHLTDFQEFLTCYLSVVQGHFFGIFYSSWDAPSTGIPIDAWC